MSPPAITSPFTEPPQSFGTEGLNIFGRGCLWLFVVISKKNTTAVAELIA